MSLLSTYYSMDVVGELPLEALGDLLRYANERELERASYPLWLVHYLFSQLSGGEAVPYEDMLKQIHEGVNTERKGSSRSAEEIIKDFAPIVERARNTPKGG